MYKIKEKDNHNSIISNNVKDVYDIIIGITGDVDEAEKTYLIVGNMQWGDVYKTSSFSIECFDETKEINTEHTRHYYVVYSFKKPEWTEYPYVAFGKGSIVVLYEKDITTFEDVLRMKNIIEETTGSINVIIESWTELKEGK